MFENDLLPLTVVQGEKHVDAVKCLTLFSGLINVFVFDILKIPSGCTAPLALSHSPSCGPERNSSIHLIGGWLKNTNARSCRYHTKSNYSCQTVSLNTKFVSSHSNGYNKLCILYCQAM